MKKLVMFFIRLTILGLILALGGYFFVYLPGLAAIAPPPNGGIFI